MIVGVTSGERIPQQLGTLTNQISIPTMNIHSHKHTVHTETCKQAGLPTQPDRSDVKAAVLRQWFAKPYDYRLSTS